MPGRVFIRAQACQVQVISVPRSVSAWPVPRRAQCPAALSAWPCQCPAVRVPDTDRGGGPAWP